MSEISILLRAVHTKVPTFSMKPQYKEPTIYTGGVDISQWSKLSKKQQEEALSKAWYIRYSFRDPETGKLKRQNNIKAGANQLKTKKERYLFLDDLRRNLSYLLSQGFNPYQDNTSLIEKVTKKWSETTLEQPKKVIEKPKQEKPVFQFDTPISMAIEKGVHLKELVQSTTSHKRFKSRINQFSTWLLENGYKLSEPIEVISKKVLLDYLNDVLESTSARNRNNTRTDLSSLFQVLYENEITGLNPVKEISVVKSKAKRNQAYTNTLLEEMQGYMDAHDPTLCLFTKFMGYALLRPIEICRLRIKDIDVANKRIRVKTKTKELENKLLLDILIKELPDLRPMDPDAFLFTPEGFGLDWEASSESKRDYFTKRFKKVKDQFGLGKNYGLYSFRHTYITLLYNKLREKFGPKESLTKLMEITGHETEKALKSYLRDVGAQFLDDYSDLYQ